MGTKADVKAPSAKRERNKLGMLQKKHQKLNRRQESLQELYRERIRLCEIKG